MKRVQRWRYYCDYCGKSGGSGGHMQKHESGCTANPNRVCGYCGRTKPVEELVRLLGSEGAHWKAGMAALREEAQSCPGCILATIRQGKFHHPKDGGPWNAESLQGANWATVGGEQQPFGFDFHAEKASWWRAHPRERRRPLALPVLGDKPAIANLLLAIVAQAELDDIPICVESLQIDLKALEQ